MKTFLLVAGDPSGDLHGAALIRAIKSIDPSARVACVGGAHMREAADEFLSDLASLGITGFLDRRGRGSRQIVLHATHIEFE